LISGTPQFQLRLSDGVVDLMKGFSLASSEGIGGTWKTPRASEHSTCDTAAGSCRNVIEPVREQFMAKILGFDTFAALPEEQITEKINRRILSGDQGMIVWWSIQAGVHVEPHSHANEQIIWMLKGKMEFRLGTEHRVCGSGDVVIIPGGAEHEAWFREDTQVIDFFAPPRDDFLVGGRPAYMNEG
jgi:unsaturated pyranuronate lyase